VGLSLRGIDASPRLNRGSFTLLEGATMFDSEWKRRIAGFLAVVALCATTAGCAVDVGSPKPADGGGQLRYYGGPKSPMWRGPSEN
jgi:hypothetical protein